jgi:hypothetical protein
MLVHPNDGGVEDQVFEVRIVRKGRKNAMPHAPFAPPVEAHEDAVPFAENRRKIAPGRPGAGDPQHCFDEHAIVRASAAGILGLADTQLLDALPLLVAQNQPNLLLQDCLPPNLQS